MAGNKPKRYPRRDLKTKGLPGDTWLFDFPQAFLMMPGHFPPNCTWCGLKLEVLYNRWRRCKRCDSGETD
jgi:hypothetical protein